MFNNYYYVSEDVIVAFPDLEKSKPFKSGYDFDKDCNYYIAKINDFSEIEEFYNNGESLDNFFAYELVDSHVDLKYTDFYEDTDDGVGFDVVIEFDFEEIENHNGVLSAIEETLSLTKEQNIAYVFWKLSNKHNINPIEMANKYFQ